jgi:hypothetical protein
VRFGLILFLLLLAELAPLDIGLVSPFHLLARPMVPEFEEENGLFV